MLSYAEMTKDFPQFFRTEDLAISDYDKSKTLVRLRSEILKNIIYHIRRNVGEE